MPLAALLTALLTAYRAFTASSPQAGASQPPVHFDHAIGTLTVAALAAALAAKHEVEGLEEGVRAFCEELGGEKLGFCGSASTIREAASSAATWADVSCLTSLCAPATCPTAALQRAAEEPGIEAVLADLGFSDGSERERVVSFMRQDKAEWARRVSLDGTDDVSLTSLMDASAAACMAALPAARQLDEQYGLSRQRYKRQYTFCGMLDEQDGLSSKPADPPAVLPAQFSCLQGVCAKMIIRLHSVVACKQYLGMPVHGSSIRLLRAQHTLSRSLLGGHTYQLSFNYSPLLFDIKSLLDRSVQNAIDVWEEGNRTVQSLVKITNTRICKTRRFHDALAVALAHADTDERAHVCRLIQLGTRAVTDGALAGAEACVAGKARIEGLQARTLQLHGRRQAAQQAECQLYPDDQDTYRLALPRRSVWDDEW